MRKAKKAVRLQADKQVQQSSAKQQIHHEISHLAVRLVALVTTSLWFIAILLGALYLGDLIHWAEVTHGLSGWKLLLAEGVEGFIYVMDCIGLAYSAVVHTFKHK